MEVSARLKGARISAQKARLVADQIRGQAVGSALNTLTFSTKKGAHLVKKFWSPRLQMRSIMKVRMWTSYLLPKYLSMKAQP